jgi:hypothetical protein
MKYMFWSVRVSQLPVHPLPNITPAIGEYTIICVGFTNLTQGAEVYGITYLSL